MKVLPSLQSRLCAVIVAALGASLVGCSTSGRNIYRPLKVLHVPKDAAEISAAATVLSVPASPEVTRSFKITTTINEQNDVLGGYSLFLPSVDFSHVFEALEAFPKNPFTWVEFGTILAFNRRFDLASEAVARGISILDSVRSSQKLPQQWTDLYAVGVLNMASYALLSGGPVDTVAITDIMRANELRPYHAMYLHWLRAGAFLDLDSPEDAQRELESGRKMVEFLQNNNLPEKELGLFGRVRYPHLFNTEARKGIFTLIEGRIKASHGKLDVAERLFAESIDQLGGRQDPLAFYSLFQQARIWHSIGRSDAALQTYLELLANEIELEESFYSPEAIRYNVGNLYFDLGQYENAVQQYKQAELDLERRQRITSEAAELRRAIHKLGPEEKGFQRRIVSQPTPLLTRVFNNRGQAYLMIARGNLASGKPVEPELSLAISDFLRADLAEGSQNHTTLMNLAEAKFLSNDLNGGISLAQVVLGIKPGFVPAIMLLVQVAETASQKDILIAASAYAALYGSLDNRNSTLGEHSVEKARDFLIRNGESAPAQFASFRLRKLYGVSSEEFLRADLSRNQNKQDWMYIELADLVLGSDNAMADSLAALGLSGVDESAVHSHPPWLVPVYRRGLEIRSIVAKSRGDHKAAGEFGKAALNLSLRKTPTRS
jgi:tetratricopeptide (TPR) repeat protein